MNRTCARGLGTFVPTSYLQAKCRLTPACAPVIAPVPAGPSWQARVPDLERRREGRRWSSYGSRRVPVAGIRVEFDLPLEVLVGARHECDPLCLQRLLGHGRTRRVMSTGGAAFRARDWSRTVFDPLSSERQRARGRRVPPACAVHRPSRVRRRMPSRLCTALSSCPSFAAPQTNKKPTRTNGTNNIRSTITMRATFIPSFFPKLPLVLAQ
jgi:hypothetical protein